MTMTAQAAGDLVEAVRRPASAIPECRLVRAVPRASFVPPDYVGSAYDDAPIPIPHQQVTTQPSLSALMVQALQLAGDEHVLEIGTGYGFQTALLARLSFAVTSIEIWPDLAAQARRNLAAEDVHNVRVVDGDGTEGVRGCPTTPPVSAASPVPPRCG
jgi:protein-L-isoaspartate(D-aspartate) O-methyltransferase